jgi:hypothetical protein
MTSRTRLALCALAVALLMAAPVHGIAKIRLRKGVVDERIRRVHHANASNLLSQQLTGEGEKVDIINFMDAQVRCRGL